MIDISDKPKENLTTTRLPRERSASYPSISLKEAVDLIEKVKKALSNNPFNRETGAKAIGYAGVTGSSASKIAAMVHFGLLQRNGDVYKISPLADRILLFKSQGDKELAIAEAVFSPKLYRDLIEKFKNQSIPTLLRNILIHDHNISEKVARQVSQDFSSSLEYAGLLRNGIVISEYTNENTDGSERAIESTPTGNSDIFDDQNNQDGEPVEDLSAIGLQTANLRLTYGRAKIVLPDRVTKRDIERVTSQINVLAVIVDE
jgi:hypothetical protein